MTTPADPNATPTGQAPAPTPAPAPPTNPQPAPAAPAPTAPTAADPAARIAALEASLAQQSTVIASLRDEAAQRRQETKQQRDAREAAEAAQGNFKAKAERLEGELTSLQAEHAKVKPLADNWLAHEQTIAASVATEIKTLPAYMQALVADMPLAKQKAIVDGYKAEQASKTPAAPPTPTTGAPAQPPKQPGPPAPPGGAPAPPPPAAGGVSLGDMTQADLDNLERTDPAAFKALMFPSSNGGGKSTLRGLFGQ